MATVFIGIGSNIDAEENIKTCANLLRADFPRITFSSVYRTAARDEEDQEDFLNAVAKIETDSSPEKLYDTLKAIEEKLGKNPPYDKGPRTIDLDILTISPLSSQLSALSSQLTIPHPRMMERRFVLEPLSELSHDWNDALKKTLDQDCEKTNIIL